MIKLDIDHIRKAITSSAPITFSAKAVTQETLIKLEKVLETFLHELGQENIKDQLAYCMREMAENAKKANIKRVYFQDKDLSITKPADYRNGMVSFREDISTNIEKYLDKLDQMGLYTKVSYLASSSFVTITVKNNVILTDSEKERIRVRLERARSFNSMEDAFLNVIDDTEGAGLGIVILVLMLKKIGLTEKSFSITTEGNETIAKITIPRSDIILENIDTVVQKIVKEIKALPQFPEHIITLQTLIRDPKASFTDISRLVSMDPSITADLLKLVNSAQYMLSKKINNIEEALKLVGLRGLSNLLFSSGSQKIIKEKYGDMKELWDHSYRTAIYAFELSRIYNVKSITDDVYVSSLLHDLGKVIIEFLHPELLKNIQQFSMEKGLQAKVFENFSIGLHHAEIGGKIAEQWNFPEHLVTSIKYHHEPHLARPEDAKLVEIVYLANSLCNTEEGVISFEQMNPQILKEYSLSTIPQMDKMRHRLKAVYERTLTR
ncbi:MAG: HDOD domain-containing protein [Spirochaetales bacterium]|nr:HDOD domain-containing protein [Spirochaetales bacterium]